MNLFIIAVSMISAITVILVLTNLTATRLVPLAGTIDRFIEEAGKHQKVPGKVHRDVRYRSGPSIGATLDMYEPLSDWKRGSAPLIVFYHGGSWIHGDKITLLILHRFLQKMRESGYFVASVNYRSGILGGIHRPVKNAVASVVWLNENAAKFGYDGQQIALYGISAGGHVALMAEARLRGRVPIAFVLSECTPVDLRAMAAGDAFRASRFLSILPGWYLKRMSPVEYVAPDMAPVLIYHGDADEVVHFRQASILANRMGEEGAHAELEIYANARHAFIGISDELWLEQETRALDFINRYFPRAAN